MNISDMLEYRQQLFNSGIILCYNGFITQDVMVGIGSTIKTRMRAKNVGDNVVRGLFALFVEQMQNVIRYSVEKECVCSGNDCNSLSYGLLVVGVEDESYFVSCANMIDNKDVQKLQSNLSYIKSLSKGELKKLYRNTLMNETPENSVGAGVGFIDIARKATKGFEFKFSPLQDGFSFFAIKAYV